MTTVTTQETPPTALPRPRPANPTGGDPAPATALIGALGRLGRAFDPDADARARSRDRIVAALAARPA